MIDSVAKRFDSVALLERMDNCPQHLFNIGGMVLGILGQMDGIFCIPFQYTGVLDSYRDRS